MKIDWKNFELHVNKKFYPLLFDTTRHLILKGGGGSGKSVFATQKIIFRMLAEKKHRFLVCRKVAKTLRESCFAQIRDTIDVLGVNALFDIRKSELRIIAKNGNEILFFGLDDVEKIKSIQGITSIWVEEASELEPNDYRQLNIRLRGFTENYKQIIATFNPISSNHWLKAEFFDNIRDNVRTHESTYKDNQFLDDEYKQELENLKNIDEYMYQVYVLNQWGSQTGAVFREFRNNPNPLRQYTHVIKPFDIPKEWTRYRTFDFGYAKPFSVGWFAMDYDGRLYRYRELYGCKPNQANTGVKWTVQQIAQKIKEIEAEYEKGLMIHGIADPSIWDASRGDSIAEQFAKEGVYFDKGENKRLPGKMQIHYRLQFDSNGYPMLYVFDTCKDFIRTIPDLTYSETNHEDIDTNQEDHIYDELRYMCSAFPIVPQKVKQIAEKRYNPLDDEQTYLYRNSVDKFILTNI